ncbi:MAG: hypothetical protein AAFX50_15790, partial [Acidobacteriota bacterium]
MADETIKLVIEGDSDDAQKAARDAKDDIKSLRDELDGLSDVNGSEALVDNLKRVADAIDGAAPPDIAKGYREIVDALTDGDVDRAAAAFERLGKTLEDIDDIDFGPVERLSDGTRAAADAGVEGASRIREAFSRIEDGADAMAKGVRAADLALEALGESPSEFLGDTENAMERQLVLLADVRNQTRKLAEEGGEGFGGFADRAAKAERRIEQLRAEIDNNADRAIPGLREELDRLEQEFRETFDRGVKEVRQFEEAAERARKDVEG